MTAKKRKINGALVWVIDRRFATPTGEERYRRAAKIQTKEAAVAEDRSVYQYFLAHNTIKPLLVSAIKEAVAELAPPKKEFTWDEAVTHYKGHEMLLVRVSTRRAYQEFLKSPWFECLKGMLLKDITSTVLIKFFADSIGHVKPATQLQHRTCIMNVMKSAKSAGMLDVVPEMPAKPKVGKQGFECPTPEELDKIINEPRGKGMVGVALKRNHLAFALAAYAGLRAGEIRALRAVDIDMAEMVITVRRSKVNGVVGLTKSHHEREIPLVHPKLIELLKERLAEIEANPKDGDTIAIQKDGKPWGQFGLRLAYVRVCKRLGLKLSRFHGLRHYYATECFARGLDSVTIKDVLGHGSLAVTDRYAHRQRRERKREKFKRAFAELQPQP